MNPNPPRLPKKNGGARKGAGRKPDWLKEQCAKIIDNKKLLAWLGRVASGEETEQQVVVMRDRDGATTEVVDVQCSTKDRIHAMELLMERGYGKATQSITLDATENFAEALAAARSSINEPQTIQ